MSANETIHTSATGGQKAGNDERYDLIPAEAFRRLAVQVGTTVFARRGGSYHQMMNHAWRFWAGEATDYATQWDHLPAAAFEAFRIVDPWLPPTWVLDDRKPGAERYDRIPPDALRQLALHFGVGARKYADDNWTRGYDWRLTFAAAIRHAEQFRAGETHDPETGSHHLIAFAWHMLVLDEFTRINRDGDTRYATKVRAWLDAEADYKVLTTPIVVPASSVFTPTSELAKCVCVTDEGIARTNRPCSTNLWPGRAPQRPRVVDHLTDAEQDAEWVGRIGHYRFDGRFARWVRTYRDGRDWIPTACTSANFGPFTEHQRQGDGTSD